MSVAVCRCLTLLSSRVSRCPPSAPPKKKKKVAAPVKKAAPKEKKSKEKAPKKKAKKAESSSDESDLGSDAAEEGSDPGEDGQNTHRLHAAHNDTRAPPPHPTPTHVIQRGHCHVAVDTVLTFRLASSFFSVFLQRWTRR